MLSLSIKESLRLFRMCQQVKALFSCSNYFLIKWNCLRIWQVSWVRKHILNNLRDFFSFSLEPILYYIKSGPPFSSLPYRDLFQCLFWVVSVEGHSIFNINLTQFQTERQKKNKDHLWVKRVKKRKGREIEKNRTTERTRTEIKWKKKTHTSFSCFQY